MSAFRRWIYCYQWIYSKSTNFSFLILTDEFVKHIEFQYWIVFMVNVNCEKMVTFEACGFEVRFR